MYPNPLVFKQIVGHTPVKHIMGLEKYLIGIDTLSLYSNFFPFGNGELLILEDGKPKIIKTTLVNKIATNLLNHFGSKF